MGLCGRIWHQLKLGFSLKEAESALHQRASSMCLLFHWPTLNVDTTWLTSWAFSHSSSSYRGGYHVTFQDTASFYHGITRLGASPNLYCGIRQLVNLGFAPSLDVTLCVHSQLCIFLLQIQSKVNCRPVRCNAFLMKFTEKVKFF